MFSIRHSQSHGYRIVLLAPMVVLQEPPATPSMRQSLKPKSDVNSPMSDAFLHSPILDDSATVPAAATDAADRAIVSLKSYSAAMHAHTERQWEHTRRQMEQASKVGLVGVEGSGHRRKGSIQRGKGEILA
ncbi:hypothetical protein MNV49_001474 [Pseudohyphozyma bogoriensis]|nr:hypothetical protein MNV49_001474 [Pseudohyphozyma bogoriensis]